MALALVNADNPTEAVPLEDREDAASTAEELGWRENAYLVVETNDLEHLYRLTRAAARTQDEAETTTEDVRDEGPVVQARLVTEDGYVYEITFTPDGREIRVAGRESGITVPRDALDGE